MQKMFLQMWWFKKKMEKIKYIFNKIIFWVVIKVPPVNVILLIYLDATIYWYFCFCHICSIFRDEVFHVKSFSACFISQFCELSFTTWDFTGWLEFFFFHILPSQYVHVLWCMSGQWKIQAFIFNGLSDMHVYPLPQITICDKKARKQPNGPLKKKKN